MEQYTLQQFSSSCPPPPFPTRGSASAPVFVVVLGLGPVDDDVVTYVLFGVEEEVVYVFCFEEEVVL